MGPVIRSFVSASVLAGGLAAVGCVDIASAVGAGLIDTEEKRFAVNGKPEVSLKTWDGSIDIRGWDRSEVLIVVEKYGIDKEATSRIQVTAEQTGNRVTLEASLPNGTSRILHWHPSTHVKLIVSVPRSADVTASSGDGSMVVADVAGVLNLRSGDGSIRGHDIGGSLRAQTGDGSISLNAVKGAADLDTGDGSIRLDGQLTGVKVRTGDGSVAVAAAPGSKAEEDWDIRTGDGSVRLDLVEGFAAELDAHTNDGRIRLYGVQVVGVTGELDRGSLRGQVGAGGRTLRVRTGDGSITLRRY